MSLCHKDNQIYFPNSSFSFADVVTLKSKNKIILQELIYNISYVWTIPFASDPLSKLKQTLSKVHYQTEHFFSGFIRDPFLQLKALANSSKFDREPITLKDKINNATVRPTKLEIIQVFKQSKRMRFFSECLVSTWLVEKTGYESRQTSKLKTTVL